MNSLFKNKNLELLSTLVSIIGTVVSLFSVYITLTNDLDRIQRFGGNYILIILLTISFTTTTYILGSVVYNSYKRKIACNHREFPELKIFSEAEIENIDKEILPMDQRLCFNRFSHTNPGREIPKYWLSSWIGANSDDKVDAIIIHDDKITGKIPVNDDIIEGKKVKVLQISYNHKIGGYWAAIIHGRYGFPTNKLWKRFLYDLNLSGYIQFYAKAVNIYGENQNNKSQQNHLLIYVRFEDENNISSGGVVVRIPSVWNEFKIPLSKFLIDRSLYEDYSKYVEQYVNRDHASFDEEKVMQVMFGCSEAMPSQAGTFHLYDLRLVQ